MHFSIEIHALRLYCGSMTQLPTKKEILEWISLNPALTSKRDIAKAFGIKGAARIDLKRVLRELEDEGHLEKRRKTYRDPDHLPPVSVLQVLAPDGNGDLFARPLEWQGEGDEPRVLVMARASDPAMGEGDRILARLTKCSGEGHHYEARRIRRIGTNPRRILGVFRATSEGGRILPVEKGDSREWQVSAEATHGAQDGELVEAEQAGPKGRLGLVRARVVARLGDPGAPKAVSLIAIYQHGIPHDFPDAAVAQADEAVPASSEGRYDLRETPLITIDPSDARDHDDACYARPDDDPANPGGFILWVAIADVAHYVRSGTPLDREARKRGNSSYFPDRVVPMLPDRLSADLCSLHEGVDRPCIALRMVLDAEGNKRGHRFERAVMRSAASLTYGEVQAARDGAPNERCLPLIDEVITPLYGAFEALMRARGRRQPLELDLPERRVELTEAGKVRSVRFVERLDAHRMIEEFMVLANVAAAETLIARKEGLLFRVHEEPSPEKLESLRDTAHAAGLVLAKGQVLKTAHLNQLLEQAAGRDEAELINLATLRAMTQAYYSPANMGHFGLALQAYAHFTSPIRRYADLIVHRALIAAHGWGDDGLTPAEREDLEGIGTHISQTERRSMAAERDTTDRYLAAFLSERVGEEFEGRISGIARFGVFVRLDENGADGLIPMRNLGEEYFHFDRDAGSLMGAETGVEITLGQRVGVRLSEAAPITGGLAFDLVRLHGEAYKKGGGEGSGRGRPGKRRSIKRRTKAAKARKPTRARRR